MKRLYFDDEHGCSEVYPQQTILLEEYCLLLVTIDQAWIIKWMSGHVLVSHCFGKRMCIW